MPSIGLSSRSFSSTSLPCGKYANSVPSWSARSFLNLQDLYWPLSPSHHVTLRDEQLAWLHSYTRTKKKKESYVQTMTVRYFGKPALLKDPIIGERQKPVCHIYTAPITEII